LPGEEKQIPRYARDDKKQLSVGGCQLSVVSQKQIPRGLEKVEKHSSAAG
jgi:hypothetical protein